MNVITIAAYTLPPGGFLLTLGRSVGSHLASFDEWPSSGRAGADVRSGPLVCFISTTWFLLGTLQRPNSELATSLWLFYPGLYSPTHYLSNSYRRCTMAIGVYLVYAVTGCASLPLAGRSRATGHLAQL